MDNYHQVTQNYSMPYTSNYSKRSHKVDCIIPTYNRPQQLPLVIANLAEQEFKDFMITIVYDGDTEANDDAHTAVCEIQSELKHELTIRHVFREQNSGTVCIPRAIGICHTSAKYIAPIDDDVINYPNKLKVLAEELDNNMDAMLVYGNRYTTRGYEQTLDRLPHWNPIQEWGVDNSQIMYRRSVYDWIPLTIARRGCDWELAKSIAKRFGSNTIVHVDEVVSNYVWHGGNRSLDDSTKHNPIYLDHYEDLIRVAEINDYKLPKAEVI